MRVINWRALQVNEQDLMEALRNASDEQGLLRQIVIALFKRQEEWESRPDSVELYDPSHRYEQGQVVALPYRERDGNFDLWKIVTVKVVHDDENPAQGRFQVVEFEGERQKRVAGVDGAKVPSLRLPVEGELEQAAEKVVEQYRADFERQLPFVSKRCWEALSELFQDAKACSTEEVMQALQEKGFLGNWSEPTQMAVTEWLLKCSGYVLVSENEWLSPDESKSVDRPIRRQPPAPRVRRDNEYYERVSLPPEGQKLAEEIGEEELEEEELSLDEWRRRTRTEPLKLPPLTFQTIVEAYFPLNRQLSEFLPPGKLKKVRLRLRAINESEPMTFWVSRGDKDKRGLKADASDREKFRKWLIGEGIPAGTTLWIERISDFEYRVYAKPLEPPRIVRQVKFASFEGGELRFDLEDVEQRWEGDPLIFKSEWRFEDPEALRQEAQRIRLPIATIVRQVFEKLDPEGQGLHWSEVFNATYLVRMCSPRTVIEILYDQPCFESLGDGRFRLNPKVPLQPDQPTSTEPVLQPELPKPLRWALDVVYNQGLTDIVDRWLIKSLGVQGLEAIKQRYRRERT